MKVLKTLKLYIRGELVRSESGRTFSVPFFSSEQTLANAPLASRKDLRAAVEAAKGAQKSWEKKSAFNRSQILYRMAEMCEGKRDEFSIHFEEALGLDQTASNKVIDNAIDTFVYFAGFCDKYQQVLGSVNPVSSPHHNFTTPEATGVVALVCDDQFNFSKIVANICGILAGGNTAVVLLGKMDTILLAPLAEVFATSDLPAGVVNLLTGQLSELLEPLASHMEINALSFQNSNKEMYKMAQEKAVENLKRVKPLFKTHQSIGPIIEFVEFKTVWHPIGI